MKIAIIISIFVLTPFIVITIFRKYQIAKNVGTVLMAFAVGILLSFLISFTDFLSESEIIKLFGDGTPEKNGLADLIMSICATLAIPLMLFSSNFSLWTRSLPKTFISMATAIFAVFAAVVVTFFIFKNSGIDTVDKVAGMMAGFYTGANFNFFAISKILEVDKTVTTITYVSEMIIVFPLLLFITAGGYKFFRWLLPFKDEALAVANSNSSEVELKDVENYNGMLTKKVFPKTMLGLLLSVSFFAIGVGLALLITGKLNVLVIIFTVTTLAILASFNEKIRTLPRTFELGMFFILIFSVIMASLFDITKLNQEAMSIFLFVLSITLITIAIHIILCRIFKISGDLFSVTIIAMFCSPPFIPPIVSAMGNRKVLISGITIGLVGYAIGTYFGIGVYYLLELF